MSHSFLLLLTMTLQRSTSRSCCLQTMSLKVHLEKLHTSSANFSSCLPQSDECYSRRAEAILKNVRALLIANPAWGESLKTIHFMLPTTSQAVFARYTALCKSVMTWKIFLFSLRGCLFIHRAPDRRYLRELVDAQRFALDRRRLVSGRGAKWGPRLVMWQEPKDASRHNGAASSSLAPCRDMTVPARACLSSITKCPNCVIDGVI